MKRVRWGPLCGLAATLVIVSFWSRPAYAYIDPGTGSAVFYVVTAVVVSLYFALRGLAYRLIDFIFRIGRSDLRCEIAVHCEDPRYEITFLPVLRSLVAEGVSVTYFTMYDRDESFAPLPAGVVHRSISPGLVGYAYLNNISATVLVTTTPQLDVMTFRRSPRVKHYSIISHALGESRYVRPYAYDFYDSILCCGPILENNIRRMEAIRGLPAKELWATGIPHWEALLEAKAECEAPPLADDVVVLVAPSWGPLSMFEALGVDFIKPIAERFKVIVRPHPQMRFSQVELYEQILCLEGVTVDTARTPAQAMSRAHILLSDISGITHEFAFIHERPVVVIDRKLTLGGLEGEVLGGDSELKARCREFIVPVDPSEIGRIADHLDDVLQEYSRARLAEARASLVYNFGCASKVAAQQLAEIFYRESGEAEVTDAPPSRLQC